MHGIRQMLASSRPDALALAQEMSLMAAGTVAELQRHREEFRRTAASALQVQPAEVTLSLAAHHLPQEESNLVLAGRDRLRELATEVAQANHANAIVAWWCLDFVQQVFAAIQGLGSGTRYGIAGKVQPMVFGPTWQGQG
jgi:hypothetical protein